MVPPCEGALKRGSTDLRRSAEIEFREPVKADAKQTHTFIFVTSDFNLLFLALRNVGNRPQ